MQEFLFFYISPILINSHISLNEQRTMFLQFLKCLLNACIHLTSLYVYILFNAMMSQIITIINQTQPHQRPFSIKIFFQFTISLISYFGFFILTSLLIDLYRIPTESHHWINASQYWKQTIFCFWSHWEVQNLYIFASLYISYFFRTS